MKLEIINHCFGEYVRVDNVDVCDMDDVYSKEEIAEKRMLLIEELKANMDVLHPGIWIEVAQALSHLESFENDENESDSDTCEQCGNWNSHDVYNKKQ